MVTETLFGEFNQLLQLTAPDLAPSRLFIIAILATLSIGMQNYLFSSAAARLTSKLRSLSFKAILRQDST